MPDIRVSLPGPSAPLVQLHPSHGIRPRSHSHPPTFVIVCPCVQATITRPIHPSAHKSIDTGLRSVTLSGNHEQEAARFSTWDRVWLPPWDRPDLQDVWTPQKG